jgi:hypothetical protein
VFFLNFNTFDSSNVMSKCSFKWMEFLEFPSSSKSSLNPSRLAWFQDVTDIEESFSIGLEAPSSRERERRGMDEKERKRRRREKGEAERKRVKVKVKRERER